MKRLLFIATFILSSISIYAQDIIVKKDGSTIMSKVLEVQTDIIKYKKWSNQSGPTYSIKITDIFSINYKNGEKDVFNSPSSTPAQTAETPQEAKPTATPAEEWSEESKARNAELIASYNKDYTINEKYIGDRNKKIKDFLTFYGVMEDSKISINNVELTINPHLFYHVSWMSARGDDTFSTFPLSVVLTNNSDKPIYIDLAQCFVVESNGKFKKLYSGEETTVTSGKNNGGSINLGSISSALGVGGAVGTISSGINVGGGKSNYTSTTYKEERFITIPPHSNKELTNIPNEIRHFSFSGYNPKPGEKITLNNLTHRVIVNYSYSNTFETKSTLELKLCLSYGYGLNKNLFNCKFYNLNDLKKYIPNADTKLILHDYIIN